MNTSAAHAFHRAAQVKRSALYLTDHDTQQPAHLPDDARCPFIGFCGPGWKSGGTVLLAINPGGGGSKYQARTSQDEELIPLIQAFRDSGPGQHLEAFERMSLSYRRQVQKWNLWRILGPTLESCRCSTEEICYVNIFPFRTAEDAKPSALALRQSWNLVTRPILNALKPGRLIALGKKAGETVTRLHAPPPLLYVVPRTIGDSYLSEEAKKVLRQISEVA